MSNTIATDGFSSLEYVVAEGEQKAKLALEIGFRNDMSSDEKYALMNELQQAVEKILEERN